jgi:hypothetical protein
MERLEAMGVEELYDPAGPEVVHHQHVHLADDVAPGGRLPGLRWIRQ